MSPMSSEIPVTEARAQFSELVNRVGFGKERIILTRHGKPLVALVPAETLDEALGEALAEEAGDTDSELRVLDLSSSRSSSGPTDYTLVARDAGHTNDST